MTRMEDRGVISWSVGDVVSWLDAEGFSGEWKAIFEKNEIDGEALQLLRDPEVLDSMGIPKPMGVRLKFWQRLENLSSGRKPKAPGSSTLSRQEPADESTEYVSSGALVGKSAPAPMGTVGDQLVAEEKLFIDSVCELLAELEADDRDVTLLLDLKVRPARRGECGARSASGSAPRPFRRGKPTPRARHTRR